MCRHWREKDKLRTYRNLLESSLIQDDSSSVEQTSRVPLVDVEKPRCSLFVSRVTEDDSGVENETL